MKGYAVYMHAFGWFVRHDAEEAADVFSSSFVDACVFGSESSAMQYATQLCERTDGGCFWVYGVYSLPRKWRGMA